MERAENSCSIWATCLVSAFSLNLKQTMCRMILLVLLVLTEGFILKGDKEGGKIDEISRMRREVILTFTF